MAWYCYLLYSEKKKHFTYNGKTNDLPRRLRQHNREISGGAQKTLKHYPYNYFCILTGYFTEKEIMKIEWMIAHPTGHRRRPIKYNGKKGRIDGLDIVLNSEKFKRIVEDRTIDLYIEKDLAQYLVLPSFICLYDLEYLPINECTN